MYGQYIRIERNYYYVPVLVFPLLTIDDMLGVTTRYIYLYNTPGMLPSSYIPTYLFNRCYFQKSFYPTLSGIRWDRATQANY